MQSQEPQPSTYPRAVLQSLISREMRYLTRYSMKSMIIHCLQDLSSLDTRVIEAVNIEVEVPEDPRFRMNEVMEAFITRAAPVSSIRYELRRAPTEQ